MTRWFAFFISTVCTLVTTSAAATPARLGLQIDQGVLLEPGARYSFTGKLVPAFDVWRFRFGASVGGTLVQPEWDVAVGFAPSFVLWPPVTRDTGVRFTTELSYLVRSHDVRLTGGLVLDFDGFQIGEIAGYDSWSHSALVLTTLGVDLPRLVRLLSEGLI